MLLTAAVVPGPPAFVAELMGAAAHELDGLREAADRAVSQALSVLVNAESESLSSDGERHRRGLTQHAVSQPAGLRPVQLVIVGPGEPDEFNAAGAVSFACFGRDVVVPALSEGQPSDADLPTPIMVARYLASRDIAAHPGHARLWGSARWITSTGADAKALGEQLGADRTWVGLIMVADGAACHGSKAPRAKDSRAQAYDESVCAALASGQPSRLAEIDVELSQELGATWGQIWPVWVAAAAATHSGADPAVVGGSEGIGEVLWAGAPYGVGWAVASWRRS